MASNPKFKQTFSECIFLGTRLDGNKEDIDLYICKVPYLSQKSILSRYGDKESEYNSYPINVVNELRTLLSKNKDMVEYLHLFQHFFDALDIAQERKLI